MFNRLILASVIYHITTKQYLTNWKEYIYYPIGYVEFVYYCLKNKPE